MKHAASSYGLLDRLIHRFAFGSRAITSVLIDLDQSFLERAGQPQAVKNPVFVSGLARSGSTILMTILNEAGCFASPNYRDMPFVYAPVLWSKLSGGARRKARSQERAHGDTIVVSEDSPEAFEEVLWKHFFPEHYRNTTIKLWDKNNRDSKFHQMLTDFARKAVLLRQNESSGPLRYLSKSNGNITRISVVLDIFPDAKIVVPFRDPVQHALSFHRQHTRFCELHDKDPFALRYMSDLGHHEFGRGIKWPLFPGFNPPKGNPDLEDWLALWNSAYQHLLREDSENLIFFDYDRACGQPDASIAALFAKLDIPEHFLSRLSTELSAQKPHNTDHEIQLPEPVAETWKKLRQSDRNLAF